MGVKMFLLPFAVLGLSRLGAEVSVRLLPMRIAWIPALLVYYLAIGGAVLWVRRAIPGARGGLTYFSGSRPGARSLVLGVLLPAALPLGFFALNVALVPLTLLGAIVVFAVANSYFEEVFWRGLMAYLPASDRVRILYSSLLFAFSHWFFTGAYWLSNPRVSFRSSLRRSSWAWPGCGSTCANAAWAMSSRRTSWSTCSTCRWPCSWAFDWRTV